MGRFINHDTEMVCFVQSRIEGRWSRRCRVESYDDCVLGWRFGVAFCYGVLGTIAKSQNATNLLMSLVE